MEDCMLISRRCANRIAEAYYRQFSSTKLIKTMNGERSEDTVYVDELYDLLYDHDFPERLLNDVKRLNRHWGRALKEFYLDFYLGKPLFVPGLYPGDYNREEAEQICQAWLVKLAEILLVLRQEHPEQLRNPAVNDGIEHMKAQLELEGFIYRNKTIVREEAAVINEPAEQDYLSSLIDALPFSDGDLIKHHLQLSEDHYINGRWDDSIANARKFLETISSQTADAISVKLDSRHLSPEMLKNITDIRDFLQRKGIIDASEKDGLKTTYALLSSTGGHPYIARQDQARLMRHLALTFCQLILIRYEGFLIANP
jgi:hypothetical protein